MQEPKAVLGPVPDFSKDVLTPLEFPEEMVTDDKVEDASRGAAWVNAQGQDGELELTQVGSDDALRRNEDVPTHTNAWENPRLGNGDNPATEDHDLFHEGQDHLQGAPNGTAASARARDRGFQDGCGNAQDDINNMNPTDGYVYVVDESSPTVSTQQLDYDNLRNTLIEIQVQNVAPNVEEANAAIAGNSGIQLRSYSDDAKRSGQKTRAEPESGAVEHQLEAVTPDITHINNSGGSAVLEYFPPPHAINADTNRVQPQLAYEGSPINLSEDSGEDSDPAKSGTHRQATDVLATEAIAGPLSQFDNYNLTVDLQNRDFAETIVGRYGSLFQLQASASEDAGVANNLAVQSSLEKPVDVEAFCREILVDQLTGPDGTNLSYSPTTSTPHTPVSAGSLPSTSRANAAGKGSSKMKKPKKMSKREAARAASAAEAAREQEIARLAKTCQITDEELLRLKPKKQRRAARFEKPVPSRFCHVCSRTPKNVRLAVCCKIKLGTCRKVICEKCFEEYKYGDFEQALKTGMSDWTCPHCLSSCPERAQCRTYQRINDRLRVNRLKQEKPVRTKAKRKRVDRDMPESKRAKLLLPAEADAGDKGVEDEPAAIAKGNMEDLKSWGELMAVQGPSLAALTSERVGKDGDNEAADAFVDDLLLGEPVGAHKE